MTTAQLDFLKWIIATLILGLTGNVISCNYNKSKLAIEKLDADSKLITAASAKFDTTLNSRLAYLGFIKAFVSTDSTRDRIQQTIAFLSPLANITTNSEIGGIVKSIENSSVKILDKSGNQAVRKRLSELGRVPSSTNNNQISINSYKESVNAVLSTLPTADILPSVDSAAIQKISQTYSLTNLPIENYTQIAAPITQWCKEGYFVEYNDVLRIGIDNLDTRIQQIKVNFKNIEKNRTSPDLIKDTVAIFTGQTYTLDQNSYRYLITLNYIGAAGRNPFTKAAYITVATYKKQ